LEYIPILLLYALIFLLFLLKPRIGFLCFVFTASFDNFLYGDAFGFKIKVYQIFLFSGLLTFLLANLLMKAKIQKDGIVLLLLSYWAVGFISLRNAENKTDSYIILTIELIAILIYFLVVQAVRDREIVRKALLAIIHSGTFVALLSIFQVVTYNLGLLSMVMHTRQFSWGRPMGTFFESNYLGAYSLSISLIIIGLLVSRQREINPIYLVISLFLQLVTLLLSMTRGAWLGLPFGLIVLFLLIRVMKKEEWGLRWITTAFLSIGVIFLLTVSVYFLVPSAPDVIWERLKSFSALNLEPESYSAESVRWGKMLQIIDVIPDRPFLGFGPGQAGMLIGEYRWYDPDIDYLRRGAGSPNLFFGIIFQRGFLGFFLFCSFLALFLKRILGSLRRITDDFLQTALMSIFLGFSGVFFTFMITDNHLLAFFWIYMGLMIGIVNIASADQDNPTGWTS
jgi:O-antigen ligase